MNDKRKQLLERASEFRFVPGHGPDIQTMTDDELERWITIMEKTFELAFSEKD
jgi:hypothetical protein